MSKSLFSRLEALQLGGDRHEHVSLKEFTVSSLKPILDDLSDVFDHVLDDSVFRLDGFPPIGLSLSSSGHIISHGLSLGEFSNLVGFFVNSRGKSGGIESTEASEFGEVGTGLVYPGLIIREVGGAFIRSFLMSISCIG